MPLSKRNVAALATGQTLRVTLLSLLVLTRSGAAQSPREVAALCGATSIRPRPSRPFENIVTAGRRPWFHDTGRCGRTDKGISLAVDDSGSHDLL